MTEQRIAALEGEIVRIRERLHGLSNSVQSVILASDLLKHLSEIPERLGRMEEKAQARADVLLEIRDALQTHSKDDDERFASHGRRIGKLEHWRMYLLGILAAISALAWIVEHFKAVSV